jgi:hypothetical protein
MFADLLADTGHIPDLEAILTADPVLYHLAYLLPHPGTVPLHEAGADLFVPGFFTGVLLPRLQAVAELDAGTCSLSLRPGGQCERRDDDQDQESTECYLSYHGVSTPGQTGKGRKGSRITRLHRNMGRGYQTISRTGSYMHEEGYPAG